MLRLLKTLAVFITILFIVAACAPVVLLNTFTPSGDFNREKNVPYGELPRQVMDIYRADTAKADTPVIVFIHGGSWSTGHKDIYKFIAQGFTKDGYSVVIPNYRLYPEVKFPAFIEDVAGAVALAVQTFPDRRLVIIGHSAGAHSALNLALNDNFLAKVGVDRCTYIAGVIGLAGPYGERPFTEEPFITIFPDRNMADDAPLNLARFPAPPLLLMTGADDTTVHPRNSPMLADAVTLRGGVATSKTYPGLNHTGIIKVISTFFDEDASVRADIEAFINDLPTDPSNTCR